MISRSAVAASSAAVAIAATLFCASLAGHGARAAEASRHFASLGATLADPTPEALRKAGVGGGVMVVAVDPDGPLAQEEFLKGDVIAEFEGHAIASVDDLAAQIGRRQSGEMVRVRSWRKGSERMLSLLTLGPIDSAAPPASPVPTDATTLGDRVDRLEREVATLSMRVDALEKARGPAH
jgi:S1-C subfamily serine protease